MHKHGERRCGSSWDISDSGASAVTVAVVMVVLIGLAALVVDLGSLYTERARLGTAADAAALAAVHKLPDTSAARTGARSYAASNAPEAPVVTITFYDGEVLYTADASSPESAATVRPAVFRPGSETGVAEAPVPAGATAVPACWTPPVEALHVPDTVKVTVTNPSAPLYFARIWNVSSSQVSASATARVQTPGLSGVMPIGVSAYSGSDPDFGLTVGQVLNLTESNAPGHYGWMTLNDPPVEDPGNNDKWQKSEFEDVARAGGTGYPVYLTQYPGVTGAKNSYESALQDWYAHSDHVAVLPVVDSWGNGSKAVTVIGFARFQITEEPRNKHIIGKYLGHATEEEMELSAFWPGSSIQHYSLIK